MIVASWIALGVPARVFKVKVPNDNIIVSMFYRVENFGIVFDSVICGLSIDTLYTKTKMFSKVKCDGTRFDKAILVRRCNSYMKQYIRTLTSDVTRTC
ncbi:hypothetical protein DPMN_123274 [Dreissena polymorpha]|uniref:Uncharacterized protein n=1 Tax=Dreissena polymorpha TaxID=45954 RepID=A0A9D4JR49_DREPO|nr:hypothetical protein DPMN_123274 [Dreissena polymorpha]